MREGTPATGSSTSTPKAPEHLNSSGLRIEYTDGKGCGVYASREIPAHTLIEVSPVLLFTAREYAEHGKHTVLDHYTFVWRDGRMALALGLAGSLFNHSQRPNVSYSIDPATESIRYVTSRRVLPDEELCILYGHKLWFGPVDAADRSQPSSELVDDSPDDPWCALPSSGVDDEDDKGEGPSKLDAMFDSFDEGDPKQVVSDEELPFRRLKLTPQDEEEEEMDAVRREDAWVVDLPDPRLAAVMLKWLKQSGFDTPSMAHLKRIRKLDDKMSMVLILTREHPDPPQFPEYIELPSPYVIPVPRSSALTMASLKLKSSFWPTIYAPRKKFEPEPWTRGKVRWACAAMKQVVQVARHARTEGELPIAAYVPIPYDEETKIATRMSDPISAHDTRKCACHPLRHSIINLVRAVGELRASSSASAPASAATPLSLPPQLTPSHPEGEVRNGAHYLLTSLTLFTTHEPCIMCSMALLHSRVKEVFYLIPMAKTGGCGRLTCVPRLQGVNHRYAVNVWKPAGAGDTGEWVKGSRLAVDEVCDA
ncbi:hypothetical protein C8T65DRAFT_791195 [Cerioporus squamosus]|nr:hypothetical protein C8T65DRAFT_791195 [Cerioporus squamosus]